MNAARFGLTVVLLLGACEQQRSRLDEVQPAKRTAEPGVAPAQPQHPTAPSAAGDAGDLSGTVVETMGAAGYTYARVDHNGTSVWLAGPETTLNVGTKLGAMQGSLMERFHSDTLNRTFDQIYFVNEYAIAAGGAAPNPHGAPASPATPMAKLDPAPGGKSISDVFAHKTELAGKPVAVRGKVVKVNNDILGRNWLHLQDGSGQPGSDDLLVTTSATVKIGDIVIASGKVALDKDFGGGYRYAVLVEDATVTPEAH